MGRLAGGDLTIEVEGAERRDEVGAIARALAVFRRTAVEAESARAEPTAKAPRKSRARRPSSG
jgi:methyl-accepting chemotaxis protein